MTAFDAVERLADAILFEGYVLYPYRASAVKNRLRWQFGVLAPKAPADHDGEPDFCETECAIDPGAEPRLVVRVRCLRPKAMRDRSDASAAVHASAWLEGRPQSIDLAPLALTKLPVEQLAEVDVAGAAARVSIEARECEGFIKLRIRVENVEAWQPEFETDRDAMLEHSLVSAHLLLAIEDGRFVSMLEPPAEAAACVAACRSRHTWPVLVGDRSQPTVMLSSPIILYDYPAVAAESGGDLCDAAEIDEILTLRIATLTEAEKEEARATDPRARAILDRVDALTPSDMDRLHGTMRSADFFNPPGAPTPDEAFVVVGDTRIAKGAAVMLRPKRRADAMDMFLRDQPAHVAGVYRDLDDRVYVAVTVDADPGASLHESFGRFFYFDPSEIEPFDSEERI